ncbi:hypothetical protein BGW80DRAFT_243615 [Lactifluus volemus]|nr:hypothetical protein BGW80DRAFT_243615 [Lactifluus volemus]
MACPRREYRADTVRHEREPSPERQLYAGAVHEAVALTPTLYPTKYLATLAASTSPRLSTARASRSSSAAVATAAPATTASQPNLVTLAARTFRQAFALAAVVSSNSPLRALQSRASSPSAPSRSPPAPRLDSSFMLLRPAAWNHFISARSELRIWVALTLLVRPRPRESRTASY